MYVEDVKNSTKKSYRITNEESNRIRILKLWLTIMVILIHSYNQEFNLSSIKVNLENVNIWFDTIKYIISRSISRCSVPAFFFISSLFLYRKQFSWKDNILKKMKTLLVPFILLNVFWVFIFFICQNISQLKVFFLNENNIIANWKVLNWLKAFGICSLNQGPICYPLWFLRNLFILNIFCSIFKIIIDKFPWISFMIISTIWFFTDESFISQSICFWGMGCLFVSKDINISELDKINKYFLFISYVFFVIADVMTRSYIINGIIRRICVIIGIAFWFVFATKIKSERIKEKLLKISQYSFSIFLFHELGLNFLIRLCAKLLPASIIYQIVEYIFIPSSMFVACLVFSVVLKKCFPKIYSILTGGRQF